MKLMLMMLGVPQLMLIMLCGSRALQPGSLQLMLMMLGVLAGFTTKVRAADAHDAGWP